jgi:hypothetical protein
LRLEGVFEEELLLLLLLLLAMLAVLSCPMSWLRSSQRSSGHPKKSAALEALES